MTPLLHAKQLFSGAVTSVNPTLTTAYTVPAGFRIIIRSAAWRNKRTSGTNDVYVYVNGVLIWHVLLATAGTSGDQQEWRPWVVAEPGQLVQVAVSNSAGANLVLSGSIYYI